MFLNGSFTHNDTEYNLIFTKHFFKKRIGSKQSRGREVFNSSTQIVNLIKYSLKKHPLVDFIDENKIILIFNKEEVQHGLLIKIESKENSQAVNIIIVTVDKIGERHYNNYIMFGKEKNRFYISDYKLPYNPIVSKTPIYSTLKKIGVNFYIHKNLEAKFKEELSLINKYKLYEKIQSKLNYEKVKKYNSSLIEICIEVEDYFIYLRTVFQRDSDLKKYSITFLNVKKIYSLDYFHNIESLKIMKIKGKELQFDKIGKSRKILKKESFKSRFQKNPTGIVLGLSQIEKIEMISHLFVENDDEIVFDLIFNKRNSLTDMEKLKELSKLKEGSLLNNVDKLCLAASCLDKNEKSKFTFLLEVVMNCERNVNLNDVFIKLIKKYNLLEYTKFKNHNNPDFFIGLD